MSDSRFCGHYYVRWEPVFDINHNHVNYEVLGYYIDYAKTIPAKCYD